MNIRKLKREEIDKIWTLDRSEVVENMYSLENGDLFLYPQHLEIRGWPQDQIEKYTPILLDCFDRGGHFYGMFLNDVLIGVTVLDNMFIGKNQDQLQLKYLYVSRSFRQHGIGKSLFNKALEKAQELKAKKLYISATPTENTINFYLNMGCQVTRELDEALYELEPEDIHLEYVIPMTKNNEVHRES